MRVTRECLSRALPVPLWGWSRILNVPTNIPARPGIPIVVCILFDHASAFFKPSVLDDRGKYLRTSKIQRACTFFPRQISAPLPAKTTNPPQRPMESACDSSG